MYIHKIEAKVATKQNSVTKKSRGFEDITNRLFLKILKSIINIDTAIFVKGYV